MKGQIKLEHRNVHCSVSDKGPYMSGVWWLNVMRFWRFAIPIACPGRKKNNNNNNKDSTEIKKTIKDSEEFGIF